MAYDKAKNMNDNQRDMRLLMRDDGCIYTWNPNLASKENFTEVKLVGDEYVEVPKKKENQERENEIAFSPLTKQMEREKEKEELKKYPSQMNRVELIKYAKEKFNYDFDPNDDLTNRERVNIIKALEKGSEK